MRWRIYNTVAHAKTAVQLDALSTISAAFEDAGIGFVIPKGLPTVLECYPEVFVTTSDVDLLVSPKDRDAAAAVLHANGFRQTLMIAQGAIVRPSTASLATVNAHSAHLLFGDSMEFAKPYRHADLDEHADFIRSELEHYFAVSRTGAVYSLAAFDLHTAFLPRVGSSAVALDEQELDWLGRPRTIFNPVVSIPTLDVETYCIAAAVRLYHDLASGRGRSLKSFADLSAHVRRHGLPYSAIEMFAKDNVAFAPALFYVYRALREFAGLSVSDELLAALASRASGPDVPPYSDLGDFLPRTFDQRWVAT
jgi:hypothetical protein